MLIHVLNIVEMLLGTGLFFFAILLWFSFKKFSSAVLSITAVLVYSRVIISLLDHYSILSLGPGGIPVLHYTVSFLILIAFIFTLWLFYKGEKNSQEHPSRSL